MGDWNMSDVTKLISIYGQLECLWNYRSHQYKRQDLKKKAWSKISLEFDRDISDIKKKIKYLRSAYVSEKKKVDDSKKSGRSGEPSYHPHLFYYDDFSFLDSVIVLRKTTSNYESDNTVDRGEEVIESAPEEVNNLLYIDEDSMPIPIPSPSPSASSSISAFSCNKTKRKNKKAPAVTGQSKFDNAVDAIVKFAKGTEETIYTSFGKTTSLQLGQLTPVEATAAMAEIHTLLSRRIMKSMSRRSRHPYFQYKNQSEFHAVGRHVNK